MTRQFLRKCNLSLSGSSSYNVSGGGQTDLRILFSIGQSTIQTPNPGRFTIFNPSQALVAQFKNKEFQSLNFDAGYESNSGRIYTGDIRQSVFAHEENVVDSTMTIYCATFGNAYQQSHVNKTLAAGWKPMDKVQLALDAMAPFGITGLGLVNVDLSQPARPRGRAIVGMARDVLREVSLSLGAVWSMQGGQVHIIDHKKSLPTDSSPVVLNSNTGLISFPHQTEGGIVAKCLINPAIGIANAVKIDESSIISGVFSNTQGTDAEIQAKTNSENTGRISSDGNYRVVFIEVEGDTRGQAWYQTLTCIATGATLNPSQAGQYGGPNLILGNY